jgi:hypothetical protein
MPIIGVIASSAKGAPGIPTIGTATDVGSGRTFVSGGRADVTFTAGAGAAATSFTIKAYTTGNVYTGLSATGASSPLSITGLTPATQYKYTVFATNAAGSSIESGYSNTVTATTIPQVPTITSATRSSNTVVSIAFTGATGGASLSAVTATSSPSISITSSGTSSPMTATGTYVQGTAYTFTITATNANGTSSASSASSSVTPYPLPTLGAFSLSTDFPPALGRYGMGSTSSSVYGVVGAGTNGQSGESYTYFWNSSTNAWGNKGNVPYSGQMPTGSWVNTGTDQVQGINPYSNAGTTFFADGQNGGWSIGTSVPGGNSCSPIAFPSSNSVRVANNSSPYNSYYRTGTGSWTSTTSYPVKSDYSISAGDTGVLFVYDASVASYTAGLTGAWSAATTIPAYWLGGNTVSNMWTYYDQNGSGVYVYTTSGYTYAGQNFPTPAGFTTWSSFKTFGTTTNEFHVVGGRQGNAPNPSYPGTNVHYKANIT